MSTTTADTVLVTQPGVSGAQLQVSDTPTAVNLVQQLTSSSAPSAAAVNLVQQLTSSPNDASAVNLVQQLNTSASNTSTPNLVQQLNQPSAPNGTAVNLAQQLMSASPSAAALNLVQQLTSQSGTPVNFVQQQLTSPTANTVTATASPAQQPQDEKPNNSIHTIHIMPNQQPVEEQADEKDPPPALVSANSVLASFAPSLMSHLQPNMVSGLISAPSLISQTSPLVTALNSSIANTLMSYTPTVTSSSPATSAPLEVAPEAVNQSQTPALITVGAVSSSIPTVTAIPVPQVSMYTAQSTTTSSVTEAIPAMPTDQMKVDSALKKDPAFPQLELGGSLSSLHVTPIHPATDPNIALTPSQLQTQFQNQLHTQLHTLQQNLQQQQGPTSPTNGSDQNTNLVNQLVYTQQQTQLTSPTNSSSKVGKGRNCFIYSLIVLCAVK